MRKDFKNLDIYAAFQPANGAEWQKANGISADWNTPKEWNTSAMLPDFLLICVVRIQ